MFGSLAIAISLLEMTLKAIAVSTQSVLPKVRGCLGRGCLSRGLQVNQQG